jgi:hypothetical protein
MIVFVLTAEHSYTHQAVVTASSGVKVDLLTYDQVPTLRATPRATYVFTDLDRLPTGTLKSAARLYQQLRTLGLRVLNDPARVLSRWGLLRRLFLQGVNEFNAYRVEEGVSPTRWPVFLRTEGDHAGPRTELFHTAAELESGLARAVADGAPVSRLLIVEYMAQPVRPGLFRKLSIFRIGEASFAHTCVHDLHWIAKDGSPGIATPELYDDELRIVRDNPYGPALAEAFNTASIEYGRADFGLVDGKVQIYEINSNPMMIFDDDHPSPVRLESGRLFKQNYFEALRAIDTI